MELDSNFIEKTILKTLFADKKFMFLVVRMFEPRFFKNSSISHIFEVCQKYINEYNHQPTIDTITNSLPEDIKEESINTLKEIEHLDLDISRQYDFIFTETNKYLQTRAVSYAILDSVDILDRGENVALIREKIESALCKDLKIDLGLDYFNTLRERLKRVLDKSKTRVPFYYPSFDDATNGGLPPYTLTVLLGRVHGMKCLSPNTKILVKIKGKIYEKNIVDIFLQSINNYSDELKGEKYMPKGSPGLSKLDLMIKKYGEEEGKKRYQMFKERMSKSLKGKFKGQSKLEYYQNKYGKKEGKKKVEKLSKNLSKALQGINTLEYYQKKYGKEKGKKLYLEKNKRVSDPGRGTAEYFIKKYGFRNGISKYFLYISRQKKSQTREGYIEKYGKEEGNRLYDERIIKQGNAHTLNGYIQRYGKEEGTKRFKERQEKWLSNFKKQNFSLISQKLFWKLYKRLDPSFKIYFAQLNPKTKEKVKEGRNFEYKLELETSFVKPDFYVKDKKKIIEFDGDYWHGSKGNVKRDRERDEAILRDRPNHKILHVKEVDWKQDPENVIKECIEFING